MNKVKKHTITEFNKSISDTLTPVKGKPYTTKLIKVKGFTDDSVYVSFGGNSFKLFLFNKIDTVFNPDYYGERNPSFYFNPYKAKKGKLEIEFSIE